MFFLQKKSNLTSSFYLKLPLAAIADGTKLNEETCSMAEMTQIGKKTHNSVSFYMSMMIYFISLG
jgi:hypothetical protein